MESKTFKGQKNPFELREHSSYVGSSCWVFLSEFIKKFPRCQWIFSSIEDNQVIEVGLSLFSGSKPFLVCVILRLWKKSRLKSKQMVFQNLGKTLWRCKRCILLRKKDTERNYPGSHQLVIRIGRRVCWRTH